MGFLDKVKDAAGKATEQVKEKAGQAKEKVEDAKLKRQIDKLTEEIGALVVAQRRGKGTPETDAEIDAKVAQIVDLERQIEENGAAGGEAEATGAAGGEAEATGAAEAG